VSVRYRWYQIRIPRSCHDYASLFAARPFSADTQHGFQSLAEISGNSRYRFLWRDRVLISTLDSYGAPAFHSVESVNFKEFCLFEKKGSYFLRIESPGRSLRELFNALEDLFGFGFSCTPITFAQSRPQLIFSAVDSSKLVGLKVSGAVLGEDVVARMEFASKHGMDVNEMSVLSSLRYNVDFASFDIAHQGIRGTVAFFANGVAKIGGQLAPLLLELLERDLPELLTSAS